MKELNEWENPFYEEPDEEQAVFDLKVCAGLLAIAILFFGFDVTADWSSESIKRAAFWVAYGTVAAYLLAARPFKGAHGYYPWQKKKE